jgi:hypothetical protein
VKELIEAVTTAHRDRDADGRITPSAAWMDLDEADRAEAFTATAELRRLEAALDPAGLSTTARAVLARIP